MLIGDLCLGFLSRQDKLSAELQVRKAAYGMATTIQG